MDLPREGHSYLSSGVVVKMKIHTFMHLHIIRCLLYCIYW